MLRFTIEGKKLVTRTEQGIFIAVGTKPFQGQYVPGREHARLHGLSLIKIIDDLFWSIQIRYPDRTILGYCSNPFLFLNFDQESSLFREAVAEGQMLISDLTFFALGGTVIPKENVVRNLGPRSALP